jgi:hypothetical protein
VKLRAVSSSKNAVGIISVLSSAFRGELADALPTQCNERPTAYISALLWQSTALQFVASFNDNFAFVCTIHIDVAIIAAQLTYTTATAAAATTMTTTTTTTTTAEWIIVESVTEETQWECHYCSSR